MKRIGFLILSWVVELRRESQKNVIGILSA